MESVYQEQSGTYNTVPINIKYIYIRIDPMLKVGISMQVCSLAYSGTMGVYQTKFVPRKCVR